MHEIKAMQAFVDANLNASFTSLYGGFLTPKEIKDVIDGKDIWMGQEEVLERFANRTGGTHLEAPITACCGTTPTKRRGRPSKAI